MKKLSLLLVVIGPFLMTQAWAGNLTVNGDLTVSNNLTAHSITLGGVTNTIWPCGGGNSLPLLGFKYVIVAEGTNDVHRGNNLRDAYSQATTLGPSSSSRVAVIVPPGTYNLGNSGLLMISNYVDLIGLVPAQITTKQVFTDNTGTKRTKTVANVRCSVCIYANPGSGNGTIKQTVDNVRIESVILSNSSGYAYYPTVYGTNTVLRHVWANSMGSAPEFAGEYIDCGSGGSFGSGKCSGTFIDCVGASFDFGGYTDASGTFISCTGGSHSFTGGQAGGKASGTFIDCVGGDTSFGADMYGQASGTFIRCVAGPNSFGGSSDAWGEGGVYGTFIDCVAGDYSFGSGGTVANSAKFQHCKAGADSFGGFGASDDFNHHFGESTVFDNDVEIDGKLSVYGGMDPPYLLLDGETRDSIATRVSREVGPNKQIGAALYWNGQTGQLEVYVASKGAYYDLSGKLLASITPPVVADATVTRSYRIDPTTGTIGLRETVQAPRWQVKPGYRFNSATGVFTKIGSDANATPVTVSLEEALELK
jgi:hypothetical protein